MREAQALSLPQPCAIRLCICRRQFSPSTAKNCVQLARARGLISGADKQRESHTPLQHRGFTKLPTLFTHCAQKTTPTNQLFPGPSARSAGPANQPPGPARVLPGSPTGQKFLRSAYSTRRTSKWVKMGYFTPLQAPRSIFSPLSILKLRHEGHSGLLDALGCQGKEPLRPLRRGRPLRECAKCGTNQPTSGGLECAEWGTTQPTQGPEWVNRVGSLVKPSGAAISCDLKNFCPREA